MASFVIHGKNKFKYSTRSERLCIALAIILALISGSVPPIINILYGEYCNLMIDRQFPKDAPSTKMNLLPVFGGGRVLYNATLKERQDALREDSFAWGVGCGSVSLVLFFFSMASVFLSCLTSSRQISRIKILFFKSILCKDLTWFDLNMKGNFAGEYSDFNKAEPGIGGVIGAFAYLLMFTFGFITPLLYGWILIPSIKFGIKFRTGLVPCQVTDILWILQMPSVEYPPTAALFLFRIFLFLANVLENLVLMERGISDVLSVFTLHLAIGVINIAISFMYGWLLALTLLVVISPIVVCAFYTAKLQTKLSVEEMHAFTRAGNIAEEVFSSIKTVIAFEGENKEIGRYSEFLSQSKKCEIKRSVLSGVSNGLLWFIIYCAYSVAFVLGVRLIETSTVNGDHQYNPSALLIIFFGIITALMSLGYATGRIGTFTVACAAAGVVYEIINTKSIINPCEGIGNKYPECRGDIEFRHVYFEYPSRTGSMTLKGLNLKIKAGETVAIVGESGTGKSTILHLLQRLYDPSRGSVLLDGQDLRTLDVAWLRQQLGVLDEDPVLFSASIRENIWYGNVSASDEEVRQAAISAGANEFITELKDGFSTDVGQQGFKLSGGQRQKIAIARILIRKPRILILDEVTAALDAASEASLQEILAKAAIGRTTLIITHRLSRIVHVDRIIVLANGVVVEEGTHHELFRANGIYRNLFENQLENFRDRRRTVKLTSQVVYQEAPVLPPGPRGRFNSITGVPRSVKSEGTLAGDPTRKIGFPEIFRWTRPELTFYLIGFLASILSGAALPVVCVLFGDIYGFLALTDFNFIKRQTDIYAAILVAVGVTAGVCVYVQMYCFGTASVRLSTRLRLRAFKSMVQQDMTFFDDEKNTVAALCFRLKEDASGVQRTFDIRLGVLMQAISTMTIGMVLSFVYNVKITLVTMATIPFLFSGVYIESVFATGTWTLEGKAMEKAAKIAGEVIGNIKLVASLTRETLFLNKYADAIAEATKNSGEKYWLRSFAFAMGQAAPFFGYAVTLWYGGRLIAEENVPYKYVIKISELLIFGTWTLGQSMVLGPSLREARSSAGRLNYIYQRNSRVPDGYSDVPTEKSSRSIVFSKVHFAYPSRTGVIPAIQNFNMRIEPGKTVAIMGASGSGKSTIFHLLLRFYDPLSGSISISKSNIRGYKLSSLRRLFGLVSQKADLFDRTIEENIAYGDNSRAVSFHEITEAAKAANIHNFILSLPLGYDTRLGSGSQLSGGQKQRIAIARVLVRNPDILLLDEATSALDPENESLVQNALDTASVGRTTLTIAHRFSAIKKADIIYVLDKGVIREFGTRQELTLLRGLFFAMQNYKAELADQDDDDDGRNNSESSET